MGHSIEALLDQVLDADLRDQWRKLHEAGLPSQGHGVSHRPHLTLTWAQSYADEAEASLGELSANLPLAVRLGALVCFPAGKGTFTLVRLVVPNSALLRLHEAVAAVVAHAPGLSGTSRPGAWTPHVTLAHRMAPAQVAQALAVLARPEADGAIVALRHWDGAAKHERILGG